MDYQKLLHFLRVIFIIITNLYCIPTYLIWMWIILLPFRILNHPLYWGIEGVLYEWLLNVVASWSHGAQYSIVELGDNIESLINDRCLLMVNHQSTADVPLLMLAFSDKSPVLASIVWIMDRMFRFTNFGAVSVTHGDYFITQGKDVRDYQMKRLKDHLLKAYVGRNRRWIILFPEGGFLYKRKETSLKYAQKNNFPIHDHVTLPRVGAMEVIVKTLRPEVLQEAFDKGEITVYPEEDKTRKCDPLKWIVDVTIVYPDIKKPLDVLAICAANRPPCTTHIYYRRYPLEDVPCDSTESLRDWVYDRWSEKDQLLREFYETGKFPMRECHTRLVTMPEWWICFLHCFFISSTILHCHLLSRVWNFGLLIQSFVLP